MSDFVDACSDVEVRSELQRILNSNNFTASDRNRRFLEYVVEESLAGRAGRLKAYNIATSVFGRPDSFDPQIDPVVRMEAGRLRRAIERFYLLEGRVCSVTIAMPKGGYVPEFRAAGAQSDVGEPAKATNGSAPLTIRVAPFDFEGDPSDTLNLHIGFTRHVMICLHQLGDGVACSELASAETAAGDPPAVNGGVVLVGDVAVVGGCFNVTALLLKAPEGRLLWGDTFRREVQRHQNVFAVRDAVAECVANGLHDYLVRAFANLGPDRFATLPPPTWEDRIGQTERHRRAASPALAQLRYGRPVPTH